MSIRGKVLWFNKRDGFGQIKDDGGSRYYFDASVVRARSLNSIKSGDIVTFVVNQEIKTPLCAKNVGLASSKATKTRTKVDRDQLQLFDN